MKKYALACLLFSSFLPAQTQFGIQIPPSHPRVWWTPERLAQARAFHAANPFTPRSDDYLGQAFRYVMTGEASYARSAINYAMSVTLNTSGTASDGARWYGEIVILTYDWCYDQMTPAERSTLIERWNGYLETLSAKSWGGPNMPQSNYQWGYFRNQIEWAIATWYENPRAAALLDNALTTRWQNSFLPHATQQGLGGVLTEGSQYGRALVEYAVVPLTTAGLMGRNMFGETNFFREAVYYLIYTTLPGQTVSRQNGNLYWEMFPFADDDRFREGGNMHAGSWADFMVNAANLWRDEPAGQYARRWHNMIRSVPSRHVMATDRGGTERSFSELPLDYYAPGSGFLFAKTGWDAGATAIHLQLGFADDDGSHGHADFGNWQMWRKGRWVSRETTGYCNTLLGYNGATVETNNPVSHNSLLIDGRGVSTSVGPVVKRVESRPEYTYGATDLTPSFRGNSGVSHVEREFLFIRPLETMVVFDRVESTAASSMKTFLAHFERQPAVDGANTYLAVNGDQALRVTTLVPSTPAYRVINEAGLIGQYRLEVETTGQPLTHFLHVLQARDATGQNVASQVSETATQYIVTLHHPARGYARVVFNKGAATSGGGFAYSATAPPAGVNPLIDRLQGIQVTNSGPVWEPLGGTAPPPIDTTAPVISGAAASGIGTNAATITWTTSEPADAQVEYGTSTAFGMASALRTTLAQTHSIGLANLSAGATYYYRVRSRDAAGNTAVSPGYSFTTAAGAVQYTITASATQGASITPSGIVTVASGANRTFSIAAAGGHEITDVLVNGSSVGPVSTYTFSNVTANQSIAVTCRLATPPPPGGTTVPITVHAFSAGNGPANLVSNALPFKPGVLFDARNIRVLDGATELRIATRVLATWPQDNSIRSLLLQFQAPFTTASKAFTVAIGTARATTDLPFTAVTWDLPVRIFTMPASYVSDSLIFWEQKPLGQSGFPDWDSKQVSLFNRIATVGTDACANSDQFYDAITTSYQLYSRSGDLTHLVTARRWALHHRRDQITLSGTSAGRPRCSTTTNTRYTYPQGLVQDYFMFGDEEAKRVSGLVVDNFYMQHSESNYYKAPNTRGFWTEREPAFSLIGILAHYEATGDAAYLNKVRDRVTSLHRMQVENGRRAWVHNLYDHGGEEEGCSTSDWGSSPWMSGLLLEAIVKYHKLSGDPIARESLLMAVDDIRSRYIASGDFAGRSFVYLGCPIYRDGVPDLDNLLAHAFGYAYKLTGNTEYREIGTAIFKTSVNDGYTGEAKHYNQQFRSSGHFPAYIATTTAPGDPQPPSVSIAAPTAGQTVSGSITLTANASGAVGVQFLIDGAPYGAEDTAAPYSVPLDSNTLTNGAHSISARARNSAGATQTCAPVAFTVENAALPPTVAITSPAPGQMVSGTISLTANAANAVGVQFLVDGAPYGAEDTAAPYTVSLNTATLTQGTHTVSARARNSSGATQTSTAVSFTVQIADTTPPAVAITSPTPGQKVSGIIWITAAATDNTGVAGVQFYGNGTPYPQELTTAPYRIQVDTSQIPPGSYTVTARARDAAGNTATSAPVTFSVQSAGTVTFNPIRINSGGPALTESGVAWSADYGYLGGTYVDTFGTVASIYATQRIGNLLRYRIAVPDGTYAVQLKFAELYFNTAGRRVFDVALNGKLVQAGLDVFAAAGGKGKVLERSYIVTVTGGQLAIDMKATVDNAMLSGIQITAP